MSSRKEILGKIRRSLGVQSNDTERLNAVNQRLETMPEGCIPKRAQISHAQQIKLFEEKVISVQGDVAHIKNYDLLPKFITEFLRSKNLPAEIRMGEDTRLGKINWQGETTLDVKKGASDGRDLTGLSHALSGIAETGTLCLLADDNNPMTLNYLPEHHIVILDAKDIIGDMETNWKKLKKHLNNGQLTRTVNFITGPSRSGDVEQTLVLGAHGPKALQVIIVGGE